MNKVLICGYLANNLNINYNGKVGFMTLAVKRPFPFNLNQYGEQVTDFLTLKFIGDKKIEDAKKYLSKGVKILVDGSVCRDRVENSDKEYNFIIVNSWEFMESKNKNYNNSNYSDSHNNPNINTSNPDNSDLLKEGFSPISEDEYDSLPF